jgi:hypothetical protein
VGHNIVIIALSAEKKQLLFMKNTSNYCEKICKILGNLHGWGRGLQKSDICGRIITFQKGGG